MKTKSTCLFLTLEEQEKILEKQNILKEALSLPPTTQEELIEIAEYILESEKREAVLESKQTTFKLQLSLIKKYLNSWTRKYFNFLF